MTEKHREYFIRFLAENICEHVDGCDICDKVFGADRTGDCPKIVEVDEDEYNTFIVSFVETLFKAVMQNKNLYFKDWEEIDTTEILDFLKGE